MNAPFGCTSTNAPSMISVASPVRTVPKMKFVSDTAIRWSESGYSTYRSSGPVTRGIGGSVLSMTPGGAALC